MPRKSAAPSGSNAQAFAAKETSLPQKKKEQGGKPCSKNCVDPISPKIWI
jgi:hypothetical protein